MNRRRLVLATAAAATAALATAATASSASTVLYSWFSLGQRGIGSIQSDGSGSTPSRIAPITSQGSTPVATGGGYVFWVSEAAAGQYNLLRAPQAGGSAENIITGACSSLGTVNATPAIAANTTHLYYSCANVNSGGMNYLARAALDGTAKDESFIGPGSFGATTPLAVAVNATHAYVVGGGPMQRIDLNGGGSASLVTSANPGAGVAVDASYVYWTDPGGQRIGRAPLDYQPGVAQNPYFISGLAYSPAEMATDGTSLFWVTVDNTGDYRLAKANVDGSGINMSFGPAYSSVYGVAVGTSGSAPAPSPAPTTSAASTAPVAGSTPDGPASLLRPITTQATKKASRQGATQVAAPVNLKDTGRYTFIFETRANSNERWTEMQVTSATRVVQQKNSRIGKKTLRKNSTAPVYTTTSANKKLVVVALIKKAQAKNLRLRVIHRAANGTLTQDVFNA